MNKITLTILNRSIISTTKKNLMYQIMKVPNLNLNLTKKLVYKLGLNLKLKIKNLKQYKFIALCNFLNKENSDRYIQNKAIKEVIKVQNFLNTYKSRRRRLNYPVNGQRTRSNAQTSK